ncbi:hypothetical protein NOR53_1652 [gamma proteobacterium NOR5-3]|nr:hypothetical protein NOR53_1652 [gamma proteobacterium NOR5-3]
MLFRLSLLFLGLDLLVGIYTADFRLFIAAPGLALLCATLARLDPSGIILACQSIRQASAEWRYRSYNDENFLPCELQAHGKLASVLLLDCICQRRDLRGVRSRARLLIFPDAMSEEHWRLLRRQLRLQLHARNA